MTAEERAHAIWDIFKCGDGTTPSERIQRIAGLIRAAEEIAYRRALEEAAQSVGTDYGCGDETVIQYLAVRRLDKRHDKNNTNSGLGQK